MGRVLPRPLHDLPLALLLCRLVLGCSGFEAYEGASGETRAAPASGSEANGAGVFLSVAEFEAARLGGAAVLDARTSDDYAAGHVPGAAHTPWEAFVDGDQTGLLSGDVERLAATLSAAGVRSDGPVVVYGKWDEAWGEEGRIFWMLEYLGHRDVRVLIGGVAAYRAAGHTLTGEPSAVQSARFTPNLRGELRATADEVRDALASGDAVILDIRTLAEYEGLAPHGSPRGGHIPEAVHFHWRDVFGDAGALLPRETVRARFQELGIGEDTLVIAYCTGGVRSGFLYTVMRWAGYSRPKNYDGSWWEWSSREELPVAR